MPSISIRRDEYPGKSDKQIAEAEVAKLSDGDRYFAIVRYKNSPETTQFTNLGFCEIPQHLSGYLHSPHCYDAEIVWERDRSIPNDRQRTHIALDGPPPPEEVDAVIDHILGLKAQEERARKSEAATTRKWWQLWKSC